MENYGNAGEFIKYITSRGRKSDPKWTEPIITQALLVASEWLDSMYEDSWIGYKANGYKQPRSWPRKSATVWKFPSYNYKQWEIPEQVCKATYEAAYRFLLDNKALQPDYTPNKYSMVSITGALTVQYNETLSNASDIQTQFPIIQTLMADLIDPNAQGDLSTLSGKAVRV